ncbi:desmoglein-2 [Coregonus clupeaformis]|uniref:desmoglein-2 n=1 Tax=Coregonus clupeaformis TaxID=59861 RepID=UPI001BDFC244|nr:desmoglein-2 [Coregonus clupeaformis]
MARVATATVLLLPFILTFMRVVAAEGGGLKLRRQKREWIIPPTRLKENVDYTSREYIAKIRSDKQYTSKVTYSLTGIGADQNPSHLFTVNKEKGLVRINGILDREKTASYHLLGVARYDNGSKAENDIDLRIFVEDQNDCQPVFVFGQSGSVNESSAAETVVMKVIATDADEVNTLHSKIYYSIVQKSSSDSMFAINYETGEIMVRQTTLDRETQDTYILTVKGSDMNGEMGGNSGTGQVVIKILDINDNIPTLEKESYEGSVEENTVNVEVLRIKAIDMDLKYTENWLAVFTIVTGNEAGYFTITTHSKTNEGIIMITKALDYEELKVLNLAISVSNKAVYYFGSSSTSGGIGGGGVIGGGITGGGKTYPIKINVVNQKEGPKFQPMVKVVTISEDSTTVTINKVITTYAAIDSETLLTATNVRYAKIYDIDNWLIIDEKTAEIKLNKVPDRESKYLVNGTYYAKIIAITTDLPSKTATGTIAIQVEDFNDHCPILTATTTTMCLGDTAVYVTAVDGDTFPNGAPFKFRVIQEDSKQKWKVEHLNATTAILRDHAHLWPGHYKVAVEISDQQGKACADVQILTMVVCTCDQVNKVCFAQVTGKDVTLGASAILLLLLGLLLLLLVPLLLLFCLCGGVASIGDFKAIPFDTKEHLIPYHTEGQGEDKEVPLLQIPVEIHGSVKAVDLAKYGGKRGFIGGAGAEGGSAGGVLGDRFTSWAMITGEHHHSHGSHQPSGRVEVDYGKSGVTMTGHEHSYFSRYGAGAYDGIALSEGVLEEYYSAKANHVAQNDQQRDDLLIYDYEGQGSPVGSVGCCSLLGTDDDLDFLNDLGPKFKTLAKICQGSIAMEAETVNVSVSSPRPRPTTSTHTEVSRDTALNVNTLNTSSITSTSSTPLQESLVTQAQGSATIRKVHIQENKVMPNQTLFIQQPPMYYAAAPTMYVVEPQPQLVLVEQRGGGGYVCAQQAVSQVGVGMGQGMVDVGGLHGSQGMMLVERQVGAGGSGEGHGHVVMGASQVLQGADHANTRGGHVITETSQTITRGAQVLQGPGQTMIGKGHLSPGGSFSQGSLSGSRKVLVVESGSGSASAAGGSASLGAAQVTMQRGQGLEVKGHSIEVRSQNGASSLSSSSLCGTAGSNEASATAGTVTTTPTAAPHSSSHTAVVQEKKISITEKHVETSTVS